MYVQGSRLILATASPSCFLFFGKFLSHLLSLFLSFLTASANKRMRSRPLGVSVSLHPHNTAFHAYAQRLVHRLYNRRPAHRFGPRRPFRTRRLALRLYARAIGP